MKSLFILVISLVLFGTICNVLIEASVVKRATSLSHVQAIYSRYKKRSYGDGTYYGVYPVGKGACTLDPLSPMATQPGWIRVAAGFANFQNSLGCGMCIEIRGTGVGSGLDPIKGPIKAVINDLCVGCKDGGMDLFTPGDGRWDISFVAIDCPTVPGEKGNIQLRFQGSNPWYIKLQVRNAKVPAAGVEALINNKFHCLTRVNDNFFVGMGLGKFQTPLRVRLTSITGEQVEASIPDIKNDVSFPAGVQFGGINSGRDLSGIKCFGQGDKYPYPPGGMKPGPPPTTKPGGEVAPTEGGNTGGGGGGNTGGGGTGGTGGGSGGSTGDAFCKGKPLNVPFPDPSDCHGFIICSDVKANKFTCGNLAFNPNINGCDHPHNVPNCT